MTALLLASTRSSIADYVDALITVYWIIILAYIVFGWIQMLGGRIPYNRWLSAVIGFVTEVSEPYLRIFRRLPLRLGPIDFSPIVAILVLQIVGGLIVNAIDA